MKFSAFTSRRAALALLLTVFSIHTVACGEIDRRRNIQNCKFSLVDIDLVEFGLENIKLRAVIEAFNPTESEALLDKFDFSLSLNGKKVGSGTNQASTPIAPGGKAALTFEFSAALAELGSQLFSALVQGGSLQYRIDGLAFVPLIFGQQLELPLSFEDQFQPLSGGESGPGWQSLVPGISGANQAAE